MNKKKTVNLGRFFKRLWLLLSLSHRKFYTLMAILVLLEVLNLSGPYLLKFIIDEITGFNPDKMNLLVALSAGLFAVYQASSIVDYFADRKIFQILVEAYEYLLSNAHKKLVCLDLGYHEKENTGNKVLKVQRGADRIIELIGNFSWDVAPTVLQIIFTTGILFFVDWRFGLIFSLFVPIFMFATLRLNKKVYPYRRGRFDEEEKASGLMTQSIININTVKSFVQEENELRSYQKVIKRFRKNLWQEFANILKFNYGRNLIIDSGRFLILLFGIYLAWKGGITIGSLVFVITVTEKAFFSLFRISRLYDRIMESAEPVDRLYELSREEPTVQNPQGGVAPEKIEGKIEFKKVSYKYEDSSERALKNVSLEALPGGMTAFVGPSGGGKTTLARLIFRHYDPQKGSVLLDGIDLRDYDLYQFRKFISIVPQDVEIFNTSIKNNIAYGKPRATVGEIEKAAKVANAEEFINNLNKKYDTVVGERGIKLSGGQRQRIGIARAVLADPRILIFDEATSNLDSYSEKMIQEAMEKIRKNRTVIVIAHRLSTIKKADQIFVLENGEVVEKGSHSELAQKSGGLYKKLTGLQELKDIE
ncbi:MAG: ABC transporter ATP-binding protein [Candidatus Moraniibacteriota bacterium]